MGPGGVPGVSNGQRATTPGSINLFWFLFAFLKKICLLCCGVCVYSQHTCGSQGDMFQEQVLSTFQVLG